MKYKIVNKITGQEWVEKKEIINLLEDFENRNKLFRLAELFLNELGDLKIVQIKDEKKVL